MINLKNLIEEFKGANPDLVNTILDVIVAHPNNFIITGRSTDKQTRLTLIKDFLKDTGIEYKPNYKKLIKYAETFLNYTTDARKEFIFDKVIPIVNPNKIDFYDLHTISKKDFDIKKTYFKAINPWAKDQVFIYCSHSEPHKITRILNQTTKNKSLDTLETPGLDFELYGDIKFRKFSIDTYIIIDKFLEMYKNDTYGMEGSIFPLTLLMSDVSNELFENLIFSYSKENRTNIPLEDLQSTDLLKLSKCYQVLEFLHHNMIMNHKEKIWPYFNIIDISFYKEKEKLGGFSLYNKTFKDSRESDIFGFFNVYVLNSYRGMGFSKLIFDEVDRISKEANITLYSSTKSSAMKNNFQKYNWELKGKYIPSETDDIFIAEEFCYVKGNKDIHTKIYPEKFITKETFFDLCKLPDVIVKHEYEIPQKSLFELDYLDLVLNKEVEYLGKMPRETRRIYDIQSYKLFPGLRETSIEWNLYSFKQENDTNNTINFIVPDYDGYSFRFNQPLISTNLFKEFDYKICSNGNFEVVMKVSIKNVKKILEKVYAYDYEDKRINNIDKEITFQINMDTDCLFRQDFYFIEDATDWEDFKEYIKKFNSREQYKNFLKEINNYNIDINGIKKNLEKTIKELNKSNLEILNTAEIEYEFFQNKCQIFIQYNSTSVTFFYVALYLLYLKETKGQ